MLEHRWTFTISAKYVVFCVEIQNPFVRLTMAISRSDLKVRSYPIPCISQSRRMKRRRVIEYPIYFRKIARKHTGQTLLHNVKVEKILLNQHSQSSQSVMQHTTIVCVISNIRWFFGLFRKSGYLVAGPTRPGITFNNQRRLYVCVCMWYALAIVCAYGANKQPSEQASKTIIRPKKGNWPTARWWPRLQFS